MSTKHVWLAAHFMESSTLHASARASTQLLAVHQTRTRWKCPPCIDGRFESQTVLQASEGHLKVFGRARHKVGQKTPCVCLATRRTIRLPGMSVPCGASQECLSRVGPAEVQKSVDRTEWRVWTLRPINTKKCHGKWPEKGRCVGDMTKNCKNTDFTFGQGLCSD